MKQTQTQSRLGGINAPRFTGATTTQSRLILGTGRVPTLSGLLNNNPIIAIAATVVGSLLRLFNSSVRAGSPQGGTTRARIDSYSATRRLRSSYVRISSRKRASVSTKVNPSRASGTNPEGRRHG